MGKFKTFKLATLLLVAGALCSSNSPDSPPMRYGDWTPYFMTRTDLEASVRWAEGPRVMTNTGKIWLAGDLIFVVERYRGVHVIDNSDPVNPKKSKFLMAPGCVDVAVKGKMIYLDNAVDLVAFDLEAGSVTDRERDYFSPPPSPDGHIYRGNDKMILVGWKKINEEGRL